MTDAAGRIRRNKANSLKSTGPVTPEGKQTSAKNALRHGLASEKVLALTRSEVEVIQDFVADVRACFTPVGPYESLLVDRLASLLWRLRRVSRIETELLHVEAYGNKLPSMQLGLAFARSSGDSDSFLKLSKYETSLDRTFHRTLHELQRAQARRAGRAVVPPVAIDVTLETP